MARTVEHEISTPEQALALIDRAKRGRWKKLALRVRTTELPDELGALERLVELRLTGQKLESLPESIGNLHGLRQLDVSDNQLRALPDAVGKLIGMQLLDASGNRLSALPKTLTDLRELETLRLGANHLTTLPPSIARLTNLRTLDLGSQETLAHLQRLGPSRRASKRRPNNRLTQLPSEIGSLPKLQRLFICANRLTSLPATLCNLATLIELQLFSNQLSSLPDEIGRLGSLEILVVNDNPLETLPESLAELTHLKLLYVGAGYGGSSLSELPTSITMLTDLQELGARACNLSVLPIGIGNLAKLERLWLSDNNLASLPSEIGNLSALKILQLDQNQLTDLPASMALLANLGKLTLEGNPLNSALQSAYGQGIDELQAYLRSLARAEPLYEAKLLVVGEGGVGKTTLLKTLTGQEPRVGEPTTHGVSIDIHAMHLPYPERQEVQVQFNAWDFGGQEVYRVTHQFFFSPRSIYLLVWEPRMGVQQCQVEDWLKLIRLRVGLDARVIIVATHARTGQRIARIDKPVFLRDYGAMIVDFVEVDNLVTDLLSGEKVGIAELKNLIGRAAASLEQMGKPFNISWRAARNELIEKGRVDPHISYDEFGKVCGRHGLDPTDTRTLAGLMHDLGYIVYYGGDERLKGDVVLQPEWLTKAIGFVLEDRVAQEREGVLPDDHLSEVWHDHPFRDEPRYEAAFYPFFLRLMEKYDVCYRLEDGQASLVAQHVPQVRPALPWLPEDEPRPGLRRLAMVCVMDEAPPGLIPWMIVRTHDYAFEQSGHRLHWQKGVFLRNRRHGEAVLELRGRECHLYAEAIWPEYFMNILRQTLSKLISDNWPGMEGRYSFTVPCQERSNGDFCQGRFDITALRQFLEEGDSAIRCQVCRTRQRIVDLLFGFEDEEPREQLARLEREIDRGFETLQRGLTGLESRIANYVMAIMRAMANEAKDGPRLFDITPVTGNWRRLATARYRLRLWCEAEGCQHPPTEGGGRGIYEIRMSREWIKLLAPYAGFVAGILKTVVPIVGPAVDVLFGAKTIEGLGVSAHLDLMKELVGVLPVDMKVLDPERLRQGVLSDDERSGLLALHALLRELDPQHANLGLHRVPTYTGDFLWLCPKHYELSQPRIPGEVSSSSGPGEVEARDWKEGHPSGS